MRINSIRIRMSLGVFCLALSVATANGQPTIALPIGASAVDLSDSRTIYVNPAALSFQDPFFLAGGRALHLGISSSEFAYRQIFVSIAAPETKFSRLGVGLRGQFLNLPVLSGGGAQALASFRVVESFALGASFGFLAQSFDRSQFDSQAQNDPFLASLNSKFVADFGLGWLWKVSRNLTLGAGANHLNRPNIAYGVVESKLPVEWSIGSVIGMGFFRASIGLTHRDDRVTPLVGIETFRPGMGFVKLGVGSDAASFEGQIHVKRGVNISARYEYPLNDLRLASSGSLEFGLVFNFRRRASIHAPVWLEPEISRRPNVDPSTIFVVDSVYDTLLIVDKHIKRSIDAMITQQELADLPEAMFTSSDSLEPDLSYLGAGQFLTKIGGLSSFGTSSDARKDSLDIVYAMEANHAEHYLDFLRKLAVRLNDDPAFRTRIVVPADLTRAKLLLSYLSLYCDIDNRMEIAVRDQDYNPGKTGFKKIPAEVFYQTLNVVADTFKLQVNVPEMRWGIISWSLIIENATGEVFHSYSGNNQIPPRYVWDWRVKNGQVIPQGKYYYYIKWQTEDGAVYSSSKQTLTVNLIDRKIAIAISKSNKLLSPMPGGKATVILN